MLRFHITPEINDHQKQCDHMKKQLADLFRSDALREMFSVLETDESSIEDRYGVRRISDGRVVEVPELGASMTASGSTPAKMGSDESMSRTPVRPAGLQESLEQHRERLYDIFRELGFIDINKPALDRWDRVVILGGAQNDIYSRVKGAIRYITPAVKSVDGVACYRPISPMERSRSSFEAKSDTEFGVMSEVFCSELPVEFMGYTDRFTSDRNLNRVSNIRCFQTRDVTDGVSSAGQGLGQTAIGASAGQDLGRTATDSSVSQSLGRVAVDTPQAYRIYAAPSSEPDIRRADTGDSVWFYLDDGGVSPDDKLLFITRNRYCNRQLLQIFSYMMKRDHINCFDIVGCLSDDELERRDDYNILKYIQEVIALLSWGRKLG